jgi:16S rRNA G966 N2-methylase RsmD
MDDLKYNKYKDNLTPYFKLFDKNINILQLGCYNKEVTQIFIENLVKKNSHLVCIDSFVRNKKYIEISDHKEFKKTFFKIIETSDKKEQIIIIKNDVLKGLQELNTNMLFDIIFFDLSYEKSDFLFEILLKNLFNIHKSDSYNKKCRYSKKNE